MSTREIREAARALALAADRHAVEGEANYRLHPEVLRTLVDSPLLTAMLPPERGGIEMPISGLTEVVTTVARGCGSAGLCTAWYVGRIWLASLFPSAGFDALCASGSSLVTDALAPRGVLKPLGNDTWELTGEWPYATGISDSQWLIATAELRDGSGAPRLFSCLVPREGFQVVPRWTAMGMRATDSQAVRVDGWRIGKDFIAGFHDLLDGKATGHRRQGPLSRYPFDALAFVAMAACALGMAERVYDEARKVLQQSTTPIDRNSSMLMDVGGQFARLRMSQAAIQKIADDIHLMVRDDAHVSLAVRQGIRVTSAEVVAQCVQGSVAVATQCGTVAMLSTHPIQRFVRDLIVLSSHIFIRPDFARGSFRDQLLTRA